MLKLFGRVSRSVSGYISSDSEIRQSPHLRGIIVRSLPKKHSAQEVSSILSEMFSLAKIDLKVDVQGKPAYAILRYEHEKDAKQTLKNPEVNLLGKKSFISSIEGFMALSPALGSGHDARRVIALNVPHSWSKDKVYSIFSQIGNIMSLELPLDYDCPINVADGEKIYKEIMGLEPIDLTLVHQSGFQPHNLIADFREYVLSEIASIQQLLNFKGNNASVIVDQLAELWRKIRKFKDLLGVAPSEVEEKINSAFSNKLVKAELTEVKNMVADDFTKLIDEYYLIKGYAKITFATREQAERAIGLSLVLYHNEDKIQVYFDRDFPDYFYNTRLVAEARLREMFKLKSMVLDTQYFDLKVKHHVDLFNTKMGNYLNLKNKYLGQDGQGDPLINQVVRTELENKDMVSGIEGIDNYGSQRRNIFFNNKDRVMPKNYFSSSDDCFEIDRKEKRLPGTTRLYDKLQDYTKKLKKSFIIDLNDMATKSEDIKLYGLLPEAQFPPEYPPTRLWSSSNEKIKARQLLMGYEEFFHEKIPDSVYEDPNLKFKTEHGEFPNSKYVYEPPYDHLKTPSEHFNKDKRKVTMKKLREKIRNINVEDIQNLESNIMIEQGEEEVKILEKANDMKIFTDDEENAKFMTEAKEFIKSIPNIDDKEIDMHRSVIEKIGPDLVMKMNQTRTKKFKYDGEDVDKYVKNLNKTKGFDAKYSKNDVGETIVHVVCEPKYNVNYEEIKMLFDKYESQVEEAENENSIEIDEEDQEKLQRFLDLDISAKNLFEELLSQVAEKKLKMKFDESVDLEQIHKWGQFTPMVNDFLDKIDGGNTMYDFTDAVFQSKKKE
ncbi:hypothetical protein SteCoe_27505 [Stentor coeruleus]|uniref:RRM domain-containing protein n=1 Tax=Stentor coeruleus TaxID=5963 RepID=A0A1R2BAM7_9CILI|nr:hypothetical protein SteCoe_27505 [Stentor coeruleus]